MNDRSQDDLIKIHQSQQGNYSNLSKVILNEVQGLVSRLWWTWIYVKIIATLLSVEVKKYKIQFKKKP
jgi:hypothetical protein